MPIIKVSRLVDSNTPIFEDALVNTREIACVYTRTILSFPACVDILFRDQSSMVCKGTVDEFLAATQIYWM